MSPSFLKPHGAANPEDALLLAKQAPAILRRTKAFPALPSFLSSESANVWITYENLLIACLVTRDVTSAHECLAKLLQRFGGDNDRIMVLKGLIKETEAKDVAGLEEVLNEYDAVLAENGANIPIAKRRVSVLKTVQRIPDAIAALVSLLNTSPTDIEAWIELSDLYLSQGLYSQAIFALEEVLVLAPNDPQNHARIGELLLMGAIASSENDSALANLIQSTKRFCRSVELSENYLRGYYGLKLVSDRLLNDSANSKSAREKTSDMFASCDLLTIKQLNELATEKLAEIVRHNGSHDSQGREEYDLNEIAAARELLRVANATGPR